MAFLEQRIDAKITHGCTFAARVVGRTMAELPNGDVFQNFTADYAIHEGDLSHGLRSAADFQAVLDAFYVCMFTPYSGLRVKDWRDHIATQANSKASSIGGSTTLFQLQRKHTFGGITYLHPIRKPVSATVVVYRTRSAVVTTASATIDYTTGVATISGHAAGDTYTWTGEFDRPMMFVDDSWTGSLEVNTLNLHVMSAPIKMRELLNP